MIAQQIYVMFYVSQNLVCGLLHDLCLSMASIWRIPWRAPLTHSCSCKQALVMWHISRLTVLLRGTQAGPVRRERKDQRRKKIMHTCRVQRTKETYCFSCFSFDPVTASTCDSHTHLVQSHIENILSKVKAVGLEGCTAEEDLWKSPLILSPKPFTCCMLLSVHIDAEGTSSEVQQHIFTEASLSCPLPLANKQADAQLCLKAKLM